MAVLLGVNIDHVATLREARGTLYPDPVVAALLAEDSGADGITLHVREDRRHIQEHDVWRLRTRLRTRMNLEIAINDWMLDFACQVLPEHVCLVPEKREELTTEGGLDVVRHFDEVAAAMARLQMAGCQVSLFIDPAREQIDAAIACKAAVIELHTGAYANAQQGCAQDDELQRIEEAVAYAKAKLIVNAGHGLTRDNVGAIARIEGIHELNIGHAIIADSIFMGLEQSVRAMRAAIDLACHRS